MGKLSPGLAKYMAAKKAGARTAPASRGVKPLMGDPATSPIPNPTMLPGVTMPGMMPVHPPSYQKSKPTKHGSTHR